MMGSADQEIGALNRAKKQRNYAAPSRKFLPMLLTLSRYHERFMASNKLAHTGDSTQLNDPCHNCLRPLLKRFLS